MNVPAFPAIADGVEFRDILHGLIQGGIAAESGGNDHGVRLQFGILARPLIVQDDAGIRHLLRDGIGADAAAFETDQRGQHVLVCGAERSIEQENVFLRLHDRDVLAEGFAEPPKKI